MYAEAYQIVHTEKTGSALYGEEVAIQADFSAMQE